MNGVEELYRERFAKVLTPLARSIEGHLKERLQTAERIDRISARPKAIESFLAKSSAKNQDGSAKYLEPLEEIQDQVGARIVTFYKSDVLRLAERVEKFYRAIEARDRVPESEAEFGYFGRHYIFFVPSDVSAPYDGSHSPKVFELQIKTLFQHAWSEANHDLGYKSGGVPLTSEDRRKLAFTSAQSWGADMIFEELFTSNR